MQLFDAPWINHDGGGIFSLDIHASGKKLATAGQDQYGAGLLVIWPIEFVFFSKDKLKDTEPSSYLARIPHAKTINCVRWAPSLGNDTADGGKRLVCGGDDPVLCIYECIGTFTSMGTLGSKSGSASKSVENYRCVQKLFGHSLDVMHVDWSPDGKHLASCSLDNTVIIWNAQKLPEKVAILKFSNGGHDRGVKGLAWDPLARFLSTQAEDNSLKIWRTDTWECEKTFTEPFSESTGTTLFCRMDWSPNGSYLVCPCAMNNGGPTAKIIHRKDWTFERDMVGFRKAVTCVRSNPRCFYRTNSTGKKMVVSCFATGSRDRSLAVWLIPSFGRPLLVLSKIFKLSVLDLAWNNLTLAACSRDGAVKLFQFTEGEIGEAFSFHEMASHTENLYGFRPNAHEQHNVHVNSEDYVFTTWLKSTNHKTQFAHLEVPSQRQKRKYYPAELETFVSKTAISKEDAESNAPCKKAKSRHIESETKKRKSICRQKTDDKLFSRASSESDEFTGFMLPQQKRLLVAQVQDKTAKNSMEVVSYVEVLNGYSTIENKCTNLPGPSNSQCSRISAYNFDRRPIWTTFTDSIVSTIAANLRDVCFIIGQGGVIVCWNLRNQELVAKQNVKEIFSLREQQFVSALLPGCNSKEVGVVLSDYQALTSSKQLGTWTIDVDNDNIKSTIFETFGEVTPSSTLFPSSMVVQSNMVPDWNALLRMSGKRCSKANRTHIQKEFHNDETQCMLESDLETLLERAIQSKSASQTRFLSSVYGLRLSQRGNIQRLAEFVKTKIRTCSDDNRATLKEILDDFCATDPTVRS
ncbi:WD domain, g-beta repeat domain-containing protein [Ditylenchus destructor]|nr:WD domain, g-beta repeat domain-containing protein [Ditylenchus destructor]